MFIVPSIPFDLVSPFMGDRNISLLRSCDFFMSIRFYQHFAPTELGIILAFGSINISPLCGSIKNRF